MRNILISLTIIGVLGAVIIGGTMATFHDKEVARNIFVAGRLDLRLDGGDGVTGEMVMSNMYPGQKMGAETIVLRNYGNVAGDTLAVTFENEFDNFETDDPDLDGPAGDSELDMSREMIVIEWRWGVTDLLEQTEEGEFANPWVKAADRAGYHDNRISLSELQTHSRVAPLVLYDGIAPGASIDWIMDIQFDTDAPNELQGDSLTTDITFKLKQ